MLYLPHYHVSASGMGATVFYFTKGAKLLGREHHAFNTALMKRTAAQAVTVGFIIIGALNHKRKSYDEQVKHDIITGIRIFVNYYCAAPCKHLILYGKKPSSWMRSYFYE